MFLRIFLNVTAVWIIKINLIDMTRQRRRRKKNKNFLAFFFFILSFEKIDFEYQVARQDTAISITDILNIEWISKLPTHNNTKQYRTGTDTKKNKEKLNWISKKKTEKNDPRNSHLKLFVFILWKGREEKKNVTE